MSRERRKVESGNEIEVDDYRHDHTCKNISPGKFVANE
jgi:hypothetical protein